MQKLSLSLIVVILFAIVGLGWGIDELFSQYQKGEEDLTSSDELTPYITMGTSLAKHIDSQNNVLQFVSNWPTSQQFSISVTASEDFQLPESLQKDFKQGRPLALESHENISIHFVLPSHQHVMTLTLNRDLIVKENSVVNILLTLVFYLGILLILMVWLYPLIRDLQGLKTSAKAFGKGDLGRRVNTESHSYITDLQTEFNHMANRIETLVSDNKMLGNAVSHDLRTPLARLRFGIEMLQETVDEEKRYKYENRMSRDIDEMEKLVDILLCYARIEQSMVSIEKREVDLQLLMYECISLQTQHKNISWSNKPNTKAFVVLGDVRYLGMLINNLLKNAQQYSDNQIKVALNYDNQKVRLTVEDDGPGIPEDKRRYLLQPFTRGSEHLETAGFGMGLAIIDRIAHWHDAQLIIDDSETLGGARFSVIFNCK